jgi:hypothetical protein
MSRRRLGISLVIGFLPRNADYGDAHRHRNVGWLMQQSARHGDHGFKIRILSKLPLNFWRGICKRISGDGDRRMSDQSHLKDGIATPVLTVIIALVFVLVVFSKFVDWVGPSSGGLVSHEIGKSTSMTR